MGRKITFEASEKSDRPRMTLVISSLNAGGAERVLSLLANSWAQRGWQITILVFVDQTFNPHFELHPDIHYRPLGIYRETTSLVARLFNNLTRVRKLRHALLDSRPDVVISFLDSVNVLTLLSCIWLKFPVVVAEHRNPETAPLSLAWRYLRRWTYRKASAITVLAERSRSYFPKAWQNKIYVMPNPVSVIPVCEIDSPERRGGAKKIVAMGRLSHEKGFDLLLEAFAKLKSEFPAWELEILGEGHLRGELEGQCRRLGLLETVRFFGVVNQPERYLTQADLFVLSSRTEGFPMALCEAMACGLPVVAADCPTGPREIIRDQVDGLLVESENADALATGMGRLMADESFRQALATKAPEITERFGLEAVLSKWDKILRSRAIRH